jgi:hypothetical protein
MGRFMSPDWSAKQDPVPYARLDNPQTLNLYAYLRNNPLAGVDADGHCPPGQDCSKVQVQATPEKPTIQENAHEVKDGQPVGPPQSGVTGTVNYTVSSNGKPIKGVHATEQNEKTITKDGNMLLASPASGTYTTKRDGVIPDTVGLVTPTNGTKQDADSVIADLGGHAFTMTDKQTLTLQIPGVGSCSYESTRTLTNSGADPRILSSYSLSITQPELIAPSH